jgi:hypothetical protein
MTEEGRKTNKCSISSTQEITLLRISIYRDILNSEIYNYYGQYITKIVTKKQNNI